MKYIALSIFILLIAINAQEVTRPSWVPEKQFREFTDCSDKNEKGDPCSKSQSPSKVTCVKAVENYKKCWDSNCLSLPNYTSFKICTDSCDSKAKEADKVLVDWVEFQQTCFIKLSGLLLTVSSIFLGSLLI